MPPDCLSLGLIAGRRGLVAAVVAGQAQAHHSQLVDDLFQGFASQVAHLHHLILGLGDQVPKLFSHSICSLKLIQF